MNCSKFLVRVSGQLIRLRTLPLSSQRLSWHQSFRCYSNEKEDLVEQFQNVNEKKLRKYIAQEKELNAKLIYAGTLTSQLIGAKFLSLSSSVLGICLTPVLMQTLTEQSLLSKLFVYSTCGFFILVTPLAFQILTRKYVSRLYYNYESQTFTAFLFNFVLMEYKLTFKLSDLIVPEMPGLFTTMIAKRTSDGGKERKLFIDYNLISDVELTKKILGYDKPIDFEKYKN